MTEDDGDTQEEFDRKHHVPTHHGSGEGEASRRFERLIEIARHEAQKRHAARECGCFKDVE